MVIGLLTILLAPQPLPVQAVPDTADLDHPLAPALEYAAEDAFVDELDESELDGAAVRLEELQELASMKLDLNRADIDALRSLPGIGQTDAQRIVEYRNRHGPMERFEELRAAGLSGRAIEAIRPYVVIRRPAKIPIAVEVLQRWTRRLDLGRGYRPDSSAEGYTGSADALFTRLRVRRGRIDVGFVLEKDAGEPFTWSPNTRRFGLDHSALHAALTDLGPLRQLIVGDFRLDAAAGLVLGQAGSMMSSGPPSQRGALRPHTSSREYGFFRGVAARLRPVSGLNVTTFYSHRYVDARYDSAETTWKLRTSSLHRTNGEIETTARALERTAGGTTSLQYRGVRAGAVITETRHSFPGALRRQLDFSGALAFGHPGIEVWAELARRGDRPAWTVSLNLDPAPEVHFWIHATGTADGAAASHSFVGATGARESRHERNFRAGIDFRPHSAWTARLESSWRRAPEHPMLEGSHQSTVFVSYHPFPWLRVQGRARTRQSDRTSTCERTVGALRCVRRESRKEVRLQVEYEHSRSLRARFRWAASIARPASSPRSPVERGFLIYQDLRWIPTSFLQLNYRLTFFDVSDFATRIATYENDLLYAFAVPAFSDRGRRSYVMARLRLGSSLTLQVKYGVTVREGVRSFGSGLDETDGSRLRELRIQLRWRSDS